jgi:hypothetical protein
MAKEQYHELADYIIDHFKESEKKLNIPVDIKYVYQADKKQKTLIKLIKINDRYSNLLHADMLVSFNEDYYDAFDEESKNILIEQELALVEFDMEKGTIKIGRADLITSSGIIKKYGVDAVERANQVRDLYNQQQADKEAENKPPKNNRNNYKK